VNATGQNILCGIIMSLNILFQNININALNWVCQEMGLLL